MKEIKIPKNFFDTLDFTLSLPTFPCRICGKEVLDVPSNWQLKKKIWN